MPELNEESTHEEIQAHVDEIAAEAEADRAGEAPEEKPKSDGERFTEDTAAEPGSEAADATSEGEAEAGEDRSWLDDDLKAEVAAFGIGEEELADFSSREEVERALRFFDRSALEAGRKAMAEGESGRDERGRFKPKEPEPEAKPKEGAYEIGLDKDVYDEGIVGEFARMRDHYESRLEALESHFAEAAAQAEEERFDTLVDSLGHADLFGKTGKESAKQLERRQDLLIAVRAHRIGLESLGRPAELDESLVGRAARMVFAEDLFKKDLKDRTRKISKQSNGRQGGGSTKSPDPPEDPRDWADRMYKEMGG